MKVVVGTSRSNCEDIRGVAGDLASAYFPWVRRDDVGASSSMLAQSPLSHLSADARQPPAMAISAQGVWDMRRWLWVGKPIASGDAGSAMRSLANSLLANAETRIVYRQESDQLGTTAATLGLTGTEQKPLPSLGVGQGLWKIKSRSFVSRHQLHPAELELFRADARYLERTRSSDEY